jgi:spore germination cell wall hydrolase CwlJ-like protein
MGKRLIAALLLLALGACADQHLPSAAQPSTDETPPLPPVKPPVPANRTQSVSPAQDPGEALQVSAADFACLAQAIYFEAGKENASGQRAVAEVVINRLRDPRFPKTVCEVVHQGGEGGPGHCQFSWWCDGRSDATGDGERWASAQQAAADALSGAYPDWTRGALFFHNKTVKPAWSKRLQLTSIIGDHIFYR